MVKQQASVSKRELVQGLLRGVRQDVDGYKQLKVLLNRQRELMQRRDNEGLSLHNAQQTKLCETLMQRAASRSQTLTMLGFEGNSRGMDKLITKLPPNNQQQVSLLWQHLLTLAKEGQQINEQNGKLLVSQQEVINAILQPQAAPTSIDYGHGR